MKLATPSCVMAFDFGTQRVGVAIGDTLTQQARPLVVLSYAHPTLLYPLISEQILKFSPKALVVGLPIHDHASPITNAARQFAQTLKQQYLLPVVLIDERFSSQAANQYRTTYPHLKDAIAAAIILETFLAAPQEYEPC